MMYYRFKTFTTSYYFPRLDVKLQYMYGLYSPYGGRLSKIYWWLFRHVKAVRRMSAIDENELDFPYKTIKETDGNDTLMSFNMGSPGVEQKYLFWDMIGLWVCRFLLSSQRSQELWN